MKTKDKKFDAVAFSREQKRELSDKLFLLSTEEILAYLKKNKSQLKPSA
jgi:hypothetical protein